MTPLKTFEQILEYLKTKPFEFWSEDVQNQIKDNAQKTVVKLKQTLEKQKLKDTRAYKIVVLLEKDVEDDFDEVGFVQHLGNLIDVYKLGEPEEELLEFLDELEDVCIESKKQLLEHHVSIENIEKVGKKMSEEDKQKADLETLQKVGIFYVLEYTLQVLFEFTRLSDGQKIKLLNDGLDVEAGSLPGYRPLHDSFRKELCYKIHDVDLRNNILRSFYKLSGVLFGDDLNKVFEGVKEFDVELLILFKNHGLEKYNAMVYSTFGSGVSIDQVLNQVQQIFVS